MAEGGDQTFDSIELLDRSFKKRLGKAKTEEEAAIRQEWSAAKVAFHTARDAHEQEAQEAWEQQNRAEEDAFAEARRRYGDPAGAINQPARAVYADPPTPISYPIRPVEVIHSEEGK